MAPVASVIKENIIRPQNRYTGKFVMLLENMCENTKFIISITSRGLSTHHT